MATRTLTESFVGALERELDPLGYAYRVDAKWISSFDGHFEYILHLADEEKRGQVEVGPGVGIRISPIEEFYARTAAHGHDFKRMGAMVNLPFMDLANAKHDMIWLIKDERSLKRAIKEIAKNFHKLAVPFFQTYGNLETLDRVFNTQPESFDYPPMAGMPINRASYGLIIGTLLGRPDFDQLCEIYDRQLTNLSNGYYLQWFRPLVQDLRENSDLLLKLWNSPPGQGGPVSQFDPAGDEAHDPEDEP